MWSAILAGPGKDELFQACQGYPASQVTFSVAEGYPMPNQANRPLIKIGKVTVKKIENCTRVNGSGQDLIISGHCLADLGDGYLDYEYFAPYYSDGKNGTIVFYERE